MTYTDPAGALSMASSIPWEAAEPSLCSSFFMKTVTAGPANLVLNSGRMSCDIYERCPYNCSVASATEATSTVRKPSMRGSPEGCAITQPARTNTGRPARKYFRLMFQILSAGAATGSRSRDRSGSTASQTRDPITPRPAATRNAAGQPKCAAINGVSEGATTPPNCPSIFMTPDTVPAEGPAMSAVTDQ